LLPFEITDSLAVAERRKRITQEGMAVFLPTLQTLPVQVERRESILARQHRLTAWAGRALGITPVEV
jgi:hypothetical protein